MEVPMLLACLAAVLVIASVILIVYSATPVTMLLAAVSVVACAVGALLAAILGRALNPHPSRSLYALESRVPAIAVVTVGVLLVGFALLMTFVSFQYFLALAIASCLTFIGAAMAVRATRSDEAANPWLYLCLLISLVATIAGVLGMLYASGG